MRDALILIDLGNSRGKWALLHGDDPVARGHSAVDSLVEDLPAMAPGTRALVSSVASAEVNERLWSRLEGRDLRPWFAESCAVLAGLTNSYREPERMGVDRWLAMLGARQRHEGRLCVVDAGSALTIDLVDAQGLHEGGYIIPGTALMERALFADTERVRYDSPVAPLLDPGRSTAEAVGHGLLLAQIGSVRTAMEEAKRSGPEPVLFLCGGGAEQFSAALDLPFRFVPDLVMEGLLQQAISLEIVPPGVRTAADRVFPRWA